MKILQVIIGAICIGLMAWVIAIGSLHFAAEATAEEIQSAAPRHHR